MRDNDFIKKSGYLPDAGALTQELMTKVAGADLVEGCRGWARGRGGGGGGGGAPPPPPPPP